MIKQIWSSSIASRRRTWASRRQRSALTLSWSGSDSGYPTADAIFVAQSQREEREAWGCLRVEAAEANLT